MKLAIKHKSGRVLFVTSDEFIANNRRKMGWIVEEVKMTSRERFENEYCLFMGITIATARDCRRESGYSDNKMEIAWRMWQASRSAVEIELPDIYSKKYSESDCCMDDFDFNIYEQDLTKTIESAGIKVKK